MNGMFEFQHQTHHPGKSRLHLDPAKVIGICQPHTTMPYEHEVAGTAPSYGSVSCTLRRAAWRPRDNIPVVHHLGCPSSGIAYDKLSAISSCEGSKGR
jgi:hypothetical protein